VQVRFVSGHAFRRAVSAALMKAPLGAEGVDWSFTTESLGSREDAQVLGKS
jgi:hypothetical protein